MNEIITRVIDMPVQIRGACVQDENGDNNIYLNARYNDAMRAEAYNHELRHIRFGHFNDDRPVEIKEAEANRK